MSDAPYEQTRPQEAPQAPRFAAVAQWQNISTLDIPNAGQQATQSTVDHYFGMPMITGTDGLLYQQGHISNLTGDGTWTYTFDTENRLLTASKTDTSVSMVYDPKHRQSQKTVGSVKSRNIYSGWQRIADYDGTAGTLQNRYVYGTSMDEALIMVSSAGTLTFLHADIVGTVVATSNSSGAEEAGLS